LESLLTWPDSTLRVFARAVVKRVEAEHLRAQREAGGD
jgi:hypothetical protein